MRPQLKLGLFLGASLMLLIGSRTASANSVFIAQTAQGGGTGADCADALEVTYFNTSGNWTSGTPTGTQIGPGTTVHLCGTITTGLQINGSGTSGNVIEVLWESRARISFPYGEMINLNGSHSYLLFDGGIACGPGTSCDTVEAANQTGYALGQAGIIEATANGSALANQYIGTQAFYNCSLCSNIEIRNLIVRNLYVHSSLSDSTGNADSGNFVFQCPGGGPGCASGTISIHDSTVHDTGNAISVEKTSSTTFNVYNIDFYHNNWAMENSGSGTRTINFYNNSCHETTNWDTSSDMFHHNCLHNYMITPSDSVALNFYNNMAYGNWGSCCTTDLLMYTELDSPDNFNVFNNVAIQYPGNFAPAIGYYATTGVFANNTMIGVATTSGNVKAIEVGGTNITFENNAVEGYGQYIVVDSGTTFIAFDHNQWGQIGKSGNAPWQYGAAGSNSFSALKTSCSCDAHGGNPAHLRVNARGVPQPRSALIGAGANLTRLGITPLDSDTSAGGTRTPLARPGSGAWDVGAYSYLGSGTALGAVAH